jgi:hypothetical protein
MYRSLANGAPRASLAQVLGTARRDGPWHNRKPPGPKQSTRARDRAGSIFVPDWPWRALIPLRKGPRYFNEVLIDVKAPLRLLPSPFTAAMIASEIPAAIRPYSIAVAPELSAKNRKNKRFNTASVTVVPDLTDIP